MMYCFTFISIKIKSPTESTPENSPVKIWPIKPLPGEKDWDFPPPRSILHNLVHPVGNIE